MHIRSPFFTPLFFSNCTKRQTSPCSSLKVRIRFFSSGSFDSQMIAGSFPFAARCRSRQFSVIFILAPWNHFTFGSLKFQSSTLSHFFFQVKFSATAPQNSSGCSILFLYSERYSSKELI